MSKTRTLGSFLIPEDARPSKTVVVEDSMSTDSCDSNSDTSTTEEDISLEASQMLSSSQKRFKPPNQSISEVRANLDAQDYSQCQNCGNKLISYEEAERITRSEAATYVEMHAAKIIELETIKFNAKQRKLIGPRALGSMVGKKKPKL